MSKSIGVLVALGVVGGLGVAALPLSTYADGTPKSEDVGITLTLDDELQISVDKSTTDKVDLSGEDHTGDATVTVKTNNTKGYNLGIKGSAATNATALTSTTNANDVIAAAAGTISNPAALDTTKSEWGYRLATWETGKFAGVTGKNDVIKTTSAPTTSAGDATVVTFGVSIADGQAAGTYEGQVTFTATNNAVDGN